MLAHMLACPFSLSLHLSRVRTHTCAGVLRRMQHHLHTSVASVWSGHCTRTGSCFVLVLPHTCHDARTQPSLPKCSEPMKRLCDLAPTSHITSCKHSPLTLPPCSLLPRTANSVSTLISAVKSSSSASFAAGGLTNLKATALPCYPSAPAAAQGMSTNFKLLLGAISG